jgi:hypothetical protein
MPFLLEKGNQPVQHQQQAIPQIADYLDFWLLHVSSCPEHGMEVFLDICQYLRVGCQHLSNIMICRMEQVCEVGKQRSPVCEIGAGMRRPDEYKTTGAFKDLVEIALGAVLAL